MLRRSVLSPPTAYLNPSKWTDKPRSWRQKTRPKRQLTVCQSTRQNTPEDLSIQQHRCHNLKYFNSTAFCVRLVSQWLTLINCSIKHVMSFTFVVIFESETTGLTEIPDV